MRQLRILMIAPQPFLRPRGTPFSVLHRIRSLAGEGGHRVDLVTYPFGEDVAIEGLRIVRAPRPPGVRDVRIGPSLAKLALDLPLARTAWRLARSGDYDLVHTHEEAGWLGARMRDRLGLPHLYDMHSSLPLQFRNFGRWNLRPVVRAFEGAERRTLAGSDAVIAICEALGERAREVGYEGPLEVIENTLDLPPPADAEARGKALRAELGLGSAPLVAYTGTLERYQGIELVLGAAEVVHARRPEVRFLLVGGTAGESGALVQEAESRGLGGVVVARPAVPPEEVHSVHRAADILITTRTRGTNTPLKLYQYLRAGRPIVATDIPSHTQVLGPESARLAPPEAGAIGEAVLAVVADPELARSLAEGAGRLRRERYGDEAYHRKVRSIVEAAMGAVPGEEA